MRDKMTKYELINKTIYLPNSGILAIGDMHLGQEFLFREPGSQIPALQLIETKNNLIEVFKKLKITGKSIKKVIFLGDIKHFFYYERGEKNVILEVLFLVGNHINRDDIILIKGNHEKMAEIADKKLLDIFIKDRFAFIHGDEEIKEAFGDNVHTIIMGHLHPAITLTDKQKVKKEKYKCYLVGKYKNKNIIILPSFVPTHEGTATNEYLTDGHCFIPAKSLMKFTVLAIGEKKVFNFGELGKL